ncbi:hypothetical protein [Serratia inhibens]|uniref:hypothetical protein n=1 Tax=Serratia inhibens TaxID=2338073 RepID=UPI001313F4D8|nr:hypothetical protein [Serratia inhibens]
MNNVKFNLEARFLIVIQGNHQLQSEKVNMATTAEEIAVQQVTLMADRVTIQPV